MNNSSIETLLDSMALMESINFSYEYPCVWTKSGTDVSYGSREFSASEMSLADIPYGYSLGSREVAKIQSEVIEERATNVFERPHTHEFPIDGEQAQAILYAVNNLENAKTVITVHNDKIFTFTCTAMKDAFDADADLMDIIFSSIKFAD